MPAVARPVPPEPALCGSRFACCRVDGDDAAQSLLYPPPPPWLPSACPPTRGVGQHVSLHVVRLGHLQQEAAGSSSSRGVYVGGGVLHQGDCRLALAQQLSSSRHGLHLPCTPCKPSAAVRPSSNAPLLPAALRARHPSQRALTKNPVLAASSAAAFSASRRPSIWPSAGGRGAGSSIGFLTGAAAAGVGGARGTQRQTERTGATAGCEA